MQRPISFVYPAILLTFVIWVCRNAAEEKRRKLNGITPYSLELKFSGNKKSTKHNERHSACTSSEIDLATVIQNAAKRLTGTPYSQIKKTDCSGIFHQVLKCISEACPNYKCFFIFEPNVYDIFIYFCITNLKNKHKKCISGA